MATVNRSPIVRKLMIATITDANFLRQLKHLWKPDLVGAGWRWVGETSLRWLEEKGEAPGRNIEILWESAAVTLDDQTTESLQELLYSISNEYEQLGEESFDTDELVKQAQAYFAQELIVRNGLEAVELAQAGQLEQAQRLMAETVPPSIPTITAINPVESPQALQEVFSQRSDSLVQLGGALQDLLGALIVPDSFVALLGNEKVGKSWLLQAIEFAGVKAGSKVLSFQCGDLSRAQKLARMSIQISGRPIKDRYCAQVLSPVPDCTLNQSGKCTNPQRLCEDHIIRKPKEEGCRYPILQPYEEVQEWYRPCWLETCSQRRFAPWWELLPEVAALTAEDVHGIWQRWDSVHPGCFRLQVFLNQTATLADMDSIITTLVEHHGWKPDIVTDDYPDIHAPEPGAYARSEYRHQENSKWMSMRQLSQKWKCSWICVTQSKEDKGKTSERWLLRENMFSEDKRKRAHPTDALGINCTSEDKRRKIWRINYLFGRDDTFDPEEQVAVLHCLERGQPNLGSYWMHKTIR